MDPTLQQYIDQARAQGKDEAYIEKMIASYNQQTGSEATYEAPEPVAQEPTIVGGLDYSGVQNLTEKGAKVDDTVYNAPEAVQPYIAQAKKEGKGKEYIEKLVTSYYNQNPDEKPYYGDEAVYDDDGELNVVGGKWGKFLNKYGGSLWDFTEDIILRGGHEGLNMRELATATGDALTGDFTPEEQQRMIEAEEAMRNNALTSGEARDYAKYIEENGDTWGSALMGAIKYPTVALASVFSSMIGMTNKYSLGVAAATGGATAATGAAAGTIGGPIGTAIGTALSLPFAIRNAFSAGGASMDGLVSLPDYLREELEKAGIEPTDENLIKAINDDGDILKIAKARSLKRAGSIYAVNLLTFKAASKVQKAVNPKLAGLNNRLKVAVKGAIETGIQVPGEGVGELVAQIAASEKVSPSEVILEAFGGLGDVAISGITDQFNIPVYNVNGEKTMTEKQVREYVMNADPADLAEDKIDIKNDSAFEREIDNIRQVKDDINTLETNAKKMKPETRKRVLGLWEEKRTLTDKKDPLSQEKLKRVNNDLKILTEEYIDGKKSEQPEGYKPYKVDSKIQKFVDKVVDRTSPKTEADAVQQVQGETKKSVLRNEGVEQKSQTKEKSEKEIRNEARDLSDEINKKGYGLDLADKKFEKNIEEAKKEFMDNEMKDIIADKVKLEGLTEEEAFNEVNDELESFGEEALDNAVEYVDRLQDYANEEFDLDLDELTPDQLEELQDRYNFLDEMGTQPSQAEVNLALDMVDDLVAKQKEFAQKTKPYSDDTIADYFNENTAEVFGDDVATEVEQRLAQDPELDYDDVYNKVIQEYLENPIKKKQIVKKMQRDGVETEAEITKKEVKPIDLSKEKGISGEIYNKFKNFVSFLEDPNLPDNVRGRFVIRNGRPAVLINPKFAKDGINEVVAHEVLGHMAKLALDQGISAKKYGDLEADVLGTSYARAEKERIGKTIPEGTKKYNNEVFAGAIGKILSDDSESNLAQKIWNALTDFVKAILGNKDAKFRRKVRRYTKDVLGGNADISRVGEGRASIEGELNLTGPLSRKLESEGHADLVKQINNLEELARASVEAEGKKYTAWNRDYVGYKANVAWKKEHGSVPKGDDKTTAEYQGYRRDALEEYFTDDVVIDNLNAKEFIDNLIKEIVNKDQLSDDRGKRLKKILKGMNPDAVGKALSNSIVDLESGDSASLPELVASVGNKLFGNEKSINPVDLQEQGLTEEEIFTTLEDYAKEKTDAAFLGAYLVNQLTSNGIIEVIPDFRAKTVNTFRVLNDDAIDKLVAEYDAISVDVPDYLTAQVGKVAKIGDYDLVTDGRKLKEKKAIDVIKKFNNTKKTIDGELFKIIEDSFEVSSLNKQGPTTTDKQHSRKMAPYYRSLAEGRMILNQMEKQSKNKQFYTTAHNYDWRGRIYDMSQGFNVQSNKIAKGLTRFSEETPLTQGGYDNLLIQAVDTDIPGKKSAIDGQPFWKQTRKQRLNEAKARVKQWVKDYNNIQKDPKKFHDLWDQADEPVIFLSTIAEIARIEAKGGFKEGKFKSGLPIHMDATTSQGQQMAQLIRDEKAAALVNMLDGSEHERGDFYLAVADMAWSDFEYTNKDGKTTKFEAFTEPSKSDLESLKEISSYLKNLAEEAEIKSKNLRSEIKERVAAEYLKKTGKKFKKTIKEAKKMLDEAMAKEDKGQYDDAIIAFYVNQAKKREEDIEEARADAKAKLDNWDIATKLWFKIGVADKMKYTDEKGKEAFKKATNAFWGRKEMYDKRRKIMKGPTMTQWYGAGMDTIQNALAKQFEDDPLFNNPKEGIYMDWTFLNHFVTRAYLANRNVFSGPARLVEILKKTTGFLNKNGDHDLQFDTEMNSFPFRQRYQNPDFAHPTISLPDGTVVKVRVATGYKNTKNSKKAQSSTPANVIHSFDSQIPAYLGVNAKYDFLSIHDNFASSPSESVQMFDDVRESMVGLYKGNSLEEWMRQVLTIDGTLLDGAEEFIQEQLGDLGDGTSYWDRRDFSGDIMLNDWAFGAPPANPNGNNPGAAKTSPSQRGSSVANEQQMENVSERTKPCK